MTTSKWLYKLSLYDNCQVYLLAPEAYQLSGANLNGFLVNFRRFFKDYIEVVEAFQTRTT